MTRSLPPGSIIGVLGSGQLGRMFAIAARQMGYRVHTYSPESDTPTGQVADKEWTGAYTDLKRVRAFARSVNVVTFEFENVPVTAADEAAKYVPVRPAGRVLHVSQNRLREKSFLSKAGFAVTPFAPVVAERDVAVAIKKVGLPAVIKTAGFGYDGKGQKKVTTLREAQAAYRSFGGASAILERLVNFTKEISVVAARGQDGTTVTFGVMENEHANHILDVTMAPARISKAQADKAMRLAEGILKKLDVVGVMCVEMFVEKGGRILVNELAPRPHNSGHLTIDACVTSQFEQQVRAVCGLPLGDASFHRPAAMANLLGDVWEKKTPRWGKALAQQGVKLHLYGKSQPRRGRKMGHLTVLASNPAEAARRARRARASLIG